MTEKEENLLLTGLLGPAFRMAEGSSSETNKMMIVSRTFRKERAR